MVQANGVNNGSGARVAQQTGAILARRIARPAQYPGRRPLSVFRPRHRHSRRSRRSITYSMAMARRPASNSSSPNATRPISAPTASAAWRSAAHRNSVSQSEDAATPFGLKLASVTIDPDQCHRERPDRLARLADASICRAAFRMPASQSPCASTCRTARSANLTLTATTNSPPGANEFTIGATPAATAANLQTALTTAVGKLAGAR